MSEQWSKILNQYVKINSNTWNPIRAIYVKTQSGWQLLNDLYTKIGDASYASVSGTNINISDYIYKREYSSENANYGLFYLVYVDLSESIYSIEYSNNENVSYLLY